MTKKLGRIQGRLIQDNNFEVIYDERNVIARKVLGEYTIDLLKYGDNNYTISFRRSPNFFFCDLYDENKFDSFQGIIQMDNREPLPTVMDRATITAPFDIAPNTISKIIGFENDDYEGFGFLLRTGVFVVPERDRFLIFSSIEGLGVNKELNYNYTEGERIALFKSSQEYDISRGFQIFLANDIAVNINKRSVDAFYYKVLENIHYYITEKNDNYTLYKIYKTNSFNLVTYVEVNNPDLSNYEILYKAYTVKKDKAKLSTFINNPFEFLVY